MRSVDPLDNIYLVDQNLVQFDLTYRLVNQSLHFFDILLIWPLAYFKVTAEDWNLTLSNFDACTNFPLWYLNVLAYCGIVTYVSQNPSHLDDIDLAQGHQRSSLSRSLKKDYLMYCDPWFPCFILLFSSTWPLYLPHSWFCPLKSGCRGALGFRF